MESKTVGSSSIDFITTHTAVTAFAKATFVLAKTLRTSPGCPGRHSYVSFCVLLLEKKKKCRVQRHLFHHSEVGEPRRDEPSLLLSSFHSKTILPGEANMVLWYFSMDIHIVF